MGADPVGADPEESDAEEFDPDPEEAETISTPCPFLAELTKCLTKKSILLERPPKKKSQQKKITKTKRINKERKFLRINQRRIPNFERC